MTKNKKKTRSPGTAATGDADLEVIRFAIELIGNVPTYNPFDSKSPECGRKRRSQLYSQFRKELGDRLVRLDALCNETLPEVIVPNPGSCPSRSGHARTPIVNLSQCIDLCSACCTEAMRALEHVKAKLANGDAPNGQFMPPEIIAARIADGEEERKRKEARRSRMPERVGEFTKREDGVTEFRRTEHSGSHSDTLSEQSVNNALPGEKGRKTKKRRRGRMLETDPEADARLAEDWKASGLGSKGEFARLRNLSVTAVKTAIDRNRKRDKPKT